MKRIAQLDGVRGVAILLVLIWHYVPSQLLGLNTPAARALRTALDLTWSGVDLFFVLSGFLIAGILIDQRDASNYFRVFYIRRACRILPLYYLMFALFIAGLAAGGAIRFPWLFRYPLPLWSYPTFTQNIVAGMRGGFGANWLGVTWSLAIEEQFYIFLPLVIFALRRDHALRLLYVLIVAAPVLRALFPGVRTFVNTPFRTDSLLTGACLAFLVRSPEAWATVQRNKRSLYALFFALLGGTAAFALRPEAFGVFVHCWLAALYSILIILVLADPDAAMARLMRARALVWLGTLSYGVYLFHQPVSGLVHGMARGAAPAIRTASDIGVTALALVITLAVAALSYAIVERPILRIGHRFRYAPPAAGPEGVSGFASDAD